MNAQYQDQQEFPVIQSPVFDNEELERPNDGSVAWPSSPSLASMSDASTEDFFTQLAQGYHPQNKQDNVQAQAEEAQAQALAGAEEEPQAQAQALVEALAEAEEEPQAQAQALVEAEGEEVPQAQALAEAEEEAQAQPQALVEAEAEEEPQAQPQALVVAEAEEEPQAQAQAVGEGQALADGQAQAHHVHMAWHTIVAAILPCNLHGSPEDFVRFTMPPHEQHRNNHHAAIDHQIHQPMAYIAAAGAPFQEPYKFPHRAALHPNQSMSIQADSRDTLQAQTHARLPNIQPTVTDTIEALRTVATAILATMPAPIVPPSITPEPLITEDSITDKDVLFGRGGGANNNPGNQTLLTRVKELQAEYKSSGNKKKRDMANKVVQSVQTQGGRFLKKVWIEATFDEAYQKVSHMFRGIHTPEGRALKRSRYATRP